MPPCKGCNSPLCPDCNPGGPKRAVSLVISAVVLGALVLTGCTSTDPCRRLAPPSPAELAVANSGAEVEREVNGTECDLVNGTWQRDSSFKSSSKTSTTKTTVRKPVPTTKSAAKR